MSFMRIILNNIQHIAFLVLTIYYTIDCLGYIPGKKMVEWYDKDFLKSINENTTVILFSDRLEFISLNQTKQTMSYSQNFDLAARLDTLSNDYNAKIITGNDTNFVNFMYVLFTIFLTTQFIPMLFGYGESLYRKMVDIYMGNEMNDDNDNDNDTGSLLKFGDPIESGKEVFIVAKDIKERFDDVIGMQDCKDDLIQIADMIRNRETYIESGATVPRGILLIGPPGTGKTMIAKAMAGECQMAFISASGSDFNEVYTGSGSKRVRELFKMARKSKPCTIFIDEIDSLGARKNIHADHASTINKILTEMDGFGDNDDVFIIAATNNENALDHALTRSGRFDIKIYTEYPNKEERFKLFKSYLNKIKISFDITNVPALCEELSNGTFYLTGADIKNIINHAARAYVKKSIDDANYQYDGITKLDILNAIDEVSIGKKKI